MPKMPRPFHNVLIPADTGEGLYTTAEVAEELDISPRSVRALATRRNLGRHLTPKCLIFTTGELDRMRLRQESGPSYQRDRSPQPLPLASHLTLKEMAWSVSQVAAHLGKSESHTRALVRQLGLGTKGKQVWQLRIEDVRALRHHLGRPSE